MRPHHCHLRMHCWCVAMTVLDSDGARDGLIERLLRAERGIAMWMMVLPWVCPMRSSRWFCAH